MQKGDKVMLKSGGPVMTVFDNDGPSAWICGWFDGESFEKDNFPEVCLLPSPRPAEPDPIPVRLEMTSSGPKLIFINPLTEYEEAQLPPGDYRIRFV